MAKTVCEMLTSVNTANLRRLGFFRGGTVSMVLTRRRWFGAEDMSVTVSVGEHPRAVISGHEVALTTTRPFYGGKRYWFACPYCRRRAGVI